MDSKQHLSRFELKELDEDARTFSGLAATWDLDLGGDVIEQGAFKRTLEHWEGSNRPLPLLDSHNAWSSVRNVVGKMEEAQETDDGLEATFSVIDGPDGDEIWRRIEGGLVDGLSIGYKAIKVRWPETEEERKQGIYRYLEEVKLREVSVVLFPMNEDARVDLASVKAVLEGTTRRQWTDEEKAELARVFTRMGYVLDVKQEAATEPPQEQEEQEEDGGEPPEGKVDPTTGKRIEALRNRIAQVQATQLATRIQKVRHSAGPLVGQ